MAAGGAAADARALGLGRAERALARRVLRPLEAQWHDGDENLVRGLLDRWVRPGEPFARTTARRLLEAAAELARIEAHAPAWWFFLWEMESVVALVAGEGGC